MYDFYWNMLLKSILDHGQCKNRELHTWLQTVFWFAYFPWSNTDKESRLNWKTYIVTIIISLSYFTKIWLIWLKEEGLEGCSKGFPQSKARGQSQGSALSARGKPIHQNSFPQINILSETVFKNPKPVRVLQLLHPWLYTLTQWKVL